MNYVLYFIAITMFITCFFVFFVYWLINIKKRNSCQRSYSIADDSSENFAKLDTIIETCVGSVNSKMVSSLKKDSNFLQSDKEEALNECKKMVYSMVNPEIIEYISSLGINPNVWINTRIEYFVRKHKNLK